MKGNVEIFGVDIDKILKWWLIKMDLSEFALAVPSTWKTFPLDTDIACLFTSSGLCLKIILCRVFFPTTPSNTTSSGFISLHGIYQPLLYYKIYLFILLIIHPPAKTIVSSQMGRIFVCFAVNTKDSALHGVGIWYSLNECMNKWNEEECGVSITQNGAVLANYNLVPRAGESEQGERSTEELAMNIV